MGDIYSMIYGAVGGGVVGVIAAVLGGVAIAYVKRLIAERDKLAERRLDTIETNHTELKAKVETHIANDNPEATKLQLNLILGALNKTGDKVDRLAEGLAEVRTEVRESKNFTQNLYTSMKEIRDRKNGN
ncbi:MAG: hypothetical protein V8T90_05305 [Victivallales bacterium]